MPEPTDGLFGGAHMSGTDVGIIGTICAAVGAGFTKLVGMIGTRLQSKDERVDKLTDEMIKTLTDQMKTDRAAASEERKALAVIIAENTTATREQNVKLQNLADAISRLPCVHPVPARPNP